MKRSHESVQGDYGEIEFLDQKLEDLHPTFHMSE